MLQEMKSELLTANDDAIKKSEVLWLAGGLLYWRGYVCQYCVHRASFALYSFGLGGELITGPK